MADWSDIIAMSHRRYEQNDAITDGWYGKTVPLHITHIVWEKMLHTNVM